MNITHIANAPGAASHQAAALWSITSPVAAPPLRFFRRIFYFSIPLDGIAGEIKVQAAATTFKAAFQPNTYNARASSEPSLVATVADSSDPAANDAAVITIDAPRKVAEVRLKPGLAPSGGFTLEFYRLDGNILSGKPTLAVNLQGNRATLTEDFRDARFAIRLKRPDGNYPNLTADAVSGLNIKSYPTGPRIGVARADDLSTLVFFWQSPGELDEGALASRGRVDAGADFADVVQRLLDGITSEFQRTAEGFNPSLPPNINLALVVESDAPCDLNVTEFKLSCHFGLEAFGSSLKEKEVLRFAGKRATTEQVSIKLPGTAKIETATLEIVESFRPNRSSSPEEEPGTDAALPQKSGVYVGIEKWVGQAFTAQQALSIGGFALGLMALADNTELSVELQEDWQEQPSGKKLFEGSIKLEQIGEHSWVTVLFPDAINLAPQPYWIVSKAARGEALWLAKTSATAVLVMEKLSGKSAWRKVSRLENLEALHRLFSLNSQTPAAQIQQSSVLSLGQNVIVGVSAEGSKTFNLKSALNIYLAGQSQTAPISIPLAFTSELPGLITVYPPRIIYDV